MSKDSVWFVIGAALFAWVGYSLYVGQTLAWETIYRDLDPIAYWIVLAIYTGFGVTCFYIPKR